MPRRRTLEGLADGVDGATGVGCCRTSTVDGCLCIEHRTRVISFSDPSLTVDLVTIGVF